ncbi:hypothetical protein AAES_128397 [Amazona aestiva]|uniref:Uncharacterized protein n=1 Tax=Amazona aestiva TaxID=12930 RepID=A0A0Q3T9D0_AMAAE|nr:hypothetical protein AAES_128397 [Amazona aestiva]
MVNSRRTGKARSGSSALAAPAVASVGTQMQLMGREAAVQSSGCRERLHCCPEGKVSNGQGCTLCSLVEVLLQQVAELQEAVTRLKGVREAEGEQHCLLRDQTVPGPRVSTVAHAGKEAANPGSWEKNRFAVLQGADEQQRSHQAQPAGALVKKVTTGIANSDAQGVASVRKHTIPEVGQKMAAQIIPRASLARSTSSGMMSMDKCGSHRGEDPGEGLAEWQELLEPISAGLSGSYASTTFDTGGSNTGKEQFDRDMVVVKEAVGRGQVPKVQKVSGVNVAPLVSGVPHSPLTLFMEDYGNIATQCFTTACSLGICFGYTMCKEIGATNASESYRHEQKTEPVKTGFCSTPGVNTIAQEYAIDGPQYAKGLGG